MRQFKASNTKRWLVCFLLLLIAFGKMNPVFCQTALQPGPEIRAVKPQPPMKNIFFNVLWGSVSGGMLLMGWSTLDDSISREDRYKFSRLTGQFLVGATYGGILGLAAGVYLSMKGITFDENLSRIAYSTDHEPLAPSRYSEYAGVPSAGSGITLINYQFRF
jgi:hypothetical protein